MDTQTDRYLLLKPDAKTEEIYDTYRRASEIYQRTVAAMGRGPKYKVTMGNTQAIRIKNETTESP